MKYKVLLSDSMFLKNSITKKQVIWVEANSFKEAYNKGCEHLSAFVYVLYPQVVPKICKRRINLAFGLGATNNYFPKRQR